MTSLHEAHEKLAQEPTPRGIPYTGNVQNRPTLETEKASRRRRDSSLQGFPSGEESLLEPITAGAVPP